MILNPLFSGTVTRVSNLINYQSVRWRRPRKPFWLGLAKSKMFVIPQPKRIPTPEETHLMQSIRAQYDTEMKSLLNFITNENPLKVTTDFEKAGALKFDPILEEKIALSLKVNDEWNAESERLGEEWREKLISEEADKAQRLIEENEKIKQAQQERIEEIVRKEKAVSENYITPENIDEAIENCLNNVEEFDFAIDLQGNRYYGWASLEKMKDQSGVEESAVLAVENKQENEVLTERN